MTETVETIERLQYTVNKLADKGATPAIIVTALAEVTVKAAMLDPTSAATLLETAAATLFTEAQILRDP